MRSLFIQRATLIAGGGLALALATAGPAAAQCASIVQDGNFEQQRSRAVGAPWFPEGNAGIDRGLGFSFQGANNAWARNVSGWNGVQQLVRLQRGAWYTLSAYVRTSANVRAGYLGFRNPAGKRFSMRFAASSGYRR